MARNRILQSGGSRLSALRRSARSSSKCVRFPIRRAPKAICGTSTSEPHMAGTDAEPSPGGMAARPVSQLRIRCAISSATVPGSPLPREVKLELTSPERKLLATPEQPFEEDPDTYNANIRRRVQHLLAVGRRGRSGCLRELRHAGRLPRARIAGHQRRRKNRDRALWPGCYRGIKAKLAEEHKAVGLIIYSDPEDDGYVVGDTFPKAPGGR